MKRATVHAQRVGDESPFEVIAHARRAMKRGRRPSMMYKGERNPEVALRKALYAVRASPGELRTLKLRPAHIPVFITPEWLREARAWVHSLRQQVPLELPSPLDDRAVVRLVPQLMDLAWQLDLPPLFARRVPARTGWFDSGVPEFTTQSSRLAGRMFPQA